MRKILLMFLFVVNGLQSQTLDASLIELDWLAGSRPYNLTKSLDNLFFSANDGVHGRELWVYRFSTHSSFLVKDILPGSSSGLETSVFLMKDNVLYFTANDGVKGYELWRSDGTEAGTYMVKDINASGDSYIATLTNYNNKIVFRAYTPSEGSELWISDGTNAGTSLVKDIYTGVNDGSPTDLFVFNGLVYFVANNGTNGYEIWKSDGTNSGTQLLKDISAFSSGVQNGNKFIVFNNNFYFFANNGSTGYELWKSDGTNAGTYLLKDIAPGSPSSSNIIEGMAADNYFIFGARTSVGKEMWKSDGTVAGTVLLRDINPVYDGVPYDQQFVKFSGKIYFTADNDTNGVELWSTDGTTVGTEMVKDIYPGISTSYIQKLTAVNDFLVFSARYDQSNINTLWKTDGTSGGTVEIRNVNLNQTTDTQLQFVENNNVVYFQGGIDSGNEDIELWATDGTFGNTDQLIDINRIAGSMSGNTRGDRFFTEFNGKMIFVSSNGVNGVEPFVSDGTIEGTKMIKDVRPSRFLGSIYANHENNPALTKVGNNIFFRGTDGDNGYELFKTDGTETNTTMVKDIVAGSGSSIDESTFFFEFNGVLYFKANNQVNGDELWRSDGTDVGTYMLKDINPGSGNGIKTIIGLGSTICKQYGVLNNLLYFVASDGVDRSIWRTDGTSSGTIKVISFPSTGVYDVDGPTILNVVNGRIFFTRNSTNSSYGNKSIWSTDGTQAGCLHLGTWNSDSASFTRNEVFNNELYFGVSVAGGAQTLMKSDGTVLGTVAVKENLGSDIPSQYSRLLDYLKICGDYLYYSLGSYGSRDYELWRTDGTTLGTIRIANDPNYGDLLFGLDQFVCAENKLFYLQDYDTDEIWVTGGNLANTNKYKINVTNDSDFSVVSGEKITNIGNYANGKLFFVGYTALSGSELYVSDVETFLNNDDFFTDPRETNGVVLYPNPAKDNLTVSSNNASNIEELQIFDLYGKLIVSQKYSSNDVKLNISKLNNGIYLVKIKTDRSFEIKRLVKN